MHTLRPATIDGVVKYSVGFATTGDVLDPRNFVPVPGAIYADIAEAAALVAYLNGGANPQSIPGPHHPEEMQAASGAAHPDDPMSAPPTPAAHPATVTARAHAEPQARRARHKA